MSCILCILDYIRDQCGLCIIQPSLATDWKTLIEVLLAALTGCFLYYHSILPHRVYVCFGVICFIKSGNCSA